MHIKHTELPDNSHAVECIYDCALDPTRRPGAIREACEVARCIAGLIGDRKGIEIAITLLLINIPLMFVGQTLMSGTFFHRSERLKIWTCSSWGDASGARLVSTAAEDHVADMVGNDTQVRGRVFT